MKHTGALIVSVFLLCCQMQGQSKPPKVQTSTKPKRQLSKVEPADPKPPISKEFMPVAQKAFHALDHLYEHFVEDYGSDAAWTPRVMAAEKARDDLNVVANTSSEKSISFGLGSYLSI